MIICLSRTLRISAEDGQNYVLQRLHTRTEGEQAGTSTWRNEGYYATLAQAAQAAIRKDLARGAVRMSATQLVESLNKAALRVAQVCEAAMSAAHAAEYEGEVVGEDFPDELFREAC